MKRKFLIFVIMMVLAGLLVSCQNLPSKVVLTLEVPTEESESGEPVTSENAADVETEEIIVRQEWTGPEAGPTVTPIVLMIEKRGEEGGPIIRSEESDVYDYISESETSQSMSSYSASASASAGMKDDMELVRFNPVNNAIVLPNQALHLDITLKNTGTTTWMLDYSIEDISAQRMAVDKVWKIPYMAGPGDTVTISVYMTAPQQLGSYSEAFQIKDAYGAVFGTFNYTLTVGSFSSVTDIPTLPPTATPTYYSAAGITATPDELWWMCTDMERSKLQDCYSFCVEYSYRPEFQNCFYDGNRYTTPVP